MFVDKSEQISFRNRTLFVGSGSQFGLFVLLQTQAPCPEIQSVSDLFVSADGADSLTIKLIFTGSFACMFSHAHSTKLYTFFPTQDQSCVCTFCCFQIPCLEFCRNLCRCPSLKYSTHRQSIARHVGGRAFCNCRPLMPAPLFG